MAETRRPASTSPPHSFASAIRATDTHLKSQPEQASDPGPAQGGHAAPPLGGTREPRSSLTPSRCGVLVINRAARADRRAWMQVGVDSLRSAGWNVAIVEATDGGRTVLASGGGSGVTDGISHASYAPPWGASESVRRLGRDFASLGRPRPASEVRYYYGRPASPPEVGLVLSNLRCLQIAVRRGWDWTLILEDDCVPMGAVGAVRSGGWGAPEVSAAWRDMLSTWQRTVQEEVLGPCHMINLGASIFAEDAPRQGSALVRAPYYWCAQSVAFSLQGAAWILARERRLRGAVVAWDDMLTVLAMGGEHPLEWGRELWRRHYATHAADSPMVSLCFRRRLSTQLSDSRIQRSAGASSSAGRSDINLPTVLS